ncbi:hypothetical protein GOARA_053_00340 [Gordonia araii NBRC 100433]|uniref:Peptidase C51 domain-containing protein n=1 Tax=Gordonia araii NBRC 100433 TaxID=1073574 RepID=G7H2Y3_9ACTN|nr:CHAP domain-containing protein [Gordonia araii]NNG98308.1 CHAP domain-containing protein [Gordonia araii NBRC 100433]GAB10208.1 hypothetical protein GOARA_053_00340 [Gordonia araii NBRC 100433]
MSAGNAVGWLGKAGIRAPFPLVDDAALTPVQRRVIAVLRQQYDHPRPGEHYAEGVTEPWCADFVSWTMREAGVVLSNPNSGSWRIPGVATLTDYYRSVGRFAGPAYRPRIGDTVLYAPTSRFGQHTNIVVGIDGDEVTTVGGNEPPTSISVNRFDRGEITGLVGYGRLP